MSAVESRLAAIIAEHGYRDDMEGFGGTSCRGQGCIWGTIQLNAREAHSAHVAAVIASSDDLAVIRIRGVHHDCE